MLHLHNQVYSNNRVAQNKYLSPCKLVLLFSLKCEPRTSKLWDINKFDIKSQAELHLFEKVILNNKEINTLFCRRDDT